MQHVVLIPGGNPEFGCVFLDPCRSGAQVHADHHHFQRGPLSELMRSIKLYPRALAYNSKSGVYVLQKQDAGCIGEDCQDNCLINVAEASPVFPALVEFIEAI